LLASPVGGSRSFERARGKGSVELKCAKIEEKIDVPLRFQVAVGAEPARGPVEHSFSEKAVCGLPEAVQEWDFASHVRRGSSKEGTFLICLEISLGVAPEDLRPLGWDIRRWATAPGALCLERDDHDREGSQGGQGDRPLERGLRRWETAREEPCPESDGHDIEVAQGALGGSSARA